MRLTPEMLEWMRIAYIRAAYQLKENKEIYEKALEWVSNEIIRRNRVAIKRNGKPLKRRA